MIFAILGSLAVAAGLFLFGYLVGLNEATRRNRSRGMWL